MKRFVMSATLLLLVSSMLLPIASASEWKFDPSLVHFYMYGAKTCPHCRHMKELIPATYGSDKFTYYELTGNNHNINVFGNISRLTGITGVPAIGIVYNGTLVAVIEGEYNVSATPEIIKAAIENNGMLLFVGGRAYILPRNETEAMETIEKLQYLFTRAGEPSKTSTTTKKTHTTTSKATANETHITTNGNDKRICGPALIIAIAMVPLFLGRNR